jgi:carboxymethylenebutenolidase
MTGRWETIAADGGDMRCYVVQPEASPVAAVAVAQHAGGVDAFIRRMTDRLGDAGFAAIAADLYHRDDPNAGDDALTRMSRLRDRNIVKDMDAAIRHVKSLPGVRSDAIGATGFCMGGRVAYLMATHDPSLRASVVFYGGNIMRAWGDGPAPFEETGGIACPILGLFGEDDGNPNPGDVAKLDGELTRLGKAHEFHSYKGAGHAFMDEDRPSYRSEAAADAWTRCVDWFNRHLNA